MPNTNTRPIRRTPSGYLDKRDAAEYLGMSTKTLDRRRQTEPLLQRTLRKGRQLFFLEESVRQYLELAKQRGCI